MNEAIISSTRIRPLYGPRLKNISLTNNTVSKENELHSSGWHFFHCSGTKDHLDANKFSIVSFESGCIVLFNQTFDKDTSLVTHNNFLFRTARQSLILLDSGSENLQMNTSNCRSVSDASNLVHSRIEICEFLAYVCNYFERLAIADNDCCKPSDGKLVESVSKNLLSFQLLLDELWQRHNKSAVESSLSSYHKLHTQLDVYCYHLDFLLCLEQGLKANIFLETPHLAYQVEKHVNVFIAHLLMLAITKFHQFSLLELVSKTPFSCECVKQAWVMLIRLLDTLHESNNQKKSFWMFVNSLLEKVTSESVSEKTLLPDEPLSIPKYFLCKEPEMFKLWLVSQLGMLYQNEGLPTKENYVQIEAIMKLVVAPDSPILETRLKTVILLITPLATSIWTAKSDVIMIMWEYFHRRLNSMFFEQNTSIDSFQVVKKTSVAMLEEVKRCLDDSFSQGDSWSLFLHLLGLYLKNSKQKHWHQIRGRIYSKFSPTKLQSLSELGLYRLSSLFLTLCLSVDMKETSVKLLELLALMKPTDSLRCHVLWRSHVALILLYLENDTDITTISQPLRIKLNSISEMQNDISSSMMRVLVGELQGLVEFDAFLKLSGSILFEAWIPHYLSSCSETDACQLYGVLLSLILKVQGDWKENWPTQASALADALWKNVLPSILASTNNTKSYECESLVGYHLTLLALQLPGPSRSFISIFCRFINSPNINVNILGKYLCLLIADLAAMKMLGKMENYQGLLVRAWLKCVVLSVDDDTGYNISSLTKFVSELPEIVELTFNKQISLCEESDTLTAFLKIVTSANSSFTDRINFYFSQVEMYLTRTTISSDALAVRLYLCAAIFVEHAPNIIYNKLSTHSKTSNLLVAIMNHLLLPPLVYSADTRLNTSVKTAISQTLHLFLKGLANFNLRSDAYIYKCFKDLIVQYLPRLAPSHSNTMQNFLSSEPVTHPLLKCFDNLHSIQSGGTGRLILEVLSATFIACKGKIRHNYTTLALAILKEVLRKWTGEAEIIRLVTECALGNVLEVIMFTEGSKNMAHRNGIEILQLLLNQSGDMQGNQANVVVTVAKEHLAFSAVYVFRMLECIARLDPQLVRASLSRIRDLVTNVEQKRGVSFDHGLRSGIEKINCLLIN